MGGGFKTKQVSILPSMLSFKRRNEKSTRFLLAPLGYTEIVQVKEDLLVLVSALKRDESEESKKSLRDRVLSAGSDLFKKQLTLKFNNREDREDWMQAIIAECDRNYLINLLDDRVSCSEKFIIQTHEEIWKRILSEKGDEPLRYAYIAAPGSAHLDVVRLIVAVTVEWIQKLLDITGPLKSYHKEPFTALLSLLVEDNCARVFFFLLRPGPKFLEIFKEDFGAGLYDPVKVGGGAKAPTNDQIITMEKNSVCLSLIKHFKERMQDAGWKKFRLFLSVVDHPSIPPFETVETMPKPSAELVWMKSKANETATINWFMAKNALKDAPYLSYFFIQRVIENYIDDQRIRQVLLLMERVPLDQKEMCFEADRVAKPLRKHFVVLKDYCKFREMWKHYNTDHSKNKDFFEAVHMEIWSRIALNDDAVLIKMFLPKEVTHNQPSFGTVLAGEIIFALGNAPLLEGLGITQSANRVPISAQDAYYVLDSFRQFVVTRLTQWVAAITGKTGELTADDAALYVDLLIASAKNSIVRAVLWLIKPVSVRSGSSRGTEFPAEPRAFCSQFLSLLEELTLPRNKAERFLSFLALTEHPLGKCLTTTKDSDGHDLASLYSDSRSIEWKTEADWMKEIGIKKWTLSWSELKLLLNDTPYFAFQILIRRFQEDGNSYRNLLQLVNSLPTTFVETSFEADIDMCGESRFGSKQHVRTALHFRDFVVSRKVIEVWNCFSTNEVSAKGFKEEVQNQLLFLLVAQRDGSNVINGFHYMMTNLSKLSSVPVNSDEMTFETIIPLLLKNRLSSDPVLRSLFIEIEEPKYEKFDDAISFQRFIEHIAEFCQKFYYGKELTVQMSAGFAEVLSACLGSSAVRAMLMLIDPLSWENVTESSSNRDRSTKNPTARLSEVVNFLLSNRKHTLTLYLLKLLRHPGVVEKDSALSMAAVPWKKETEWLEKVWHDVTLAFDEVDFTLLGNPAYLLFRYICRDFHRIDHDVMHSTVDNVKQLMPPRTEEESFSAQLNYFPCSKALNRAAIEPITAPHFAYLRKYSLFHSLWHVQLKGLLDPIIDLTFQDSVVFKLWGLVSGSGGNHKLSNIFAPSNSAIHWDERLTYLVVLQRFAVLKVHLNDPLILPKVCPGFSAPEPLPTLSEDEIDAHHLLINCILSWVHKLLDLTQPQPGSFLEGREPPTQDQLASLFVEFIILCFNDVAMRTFVTAFIPSPSTVEGFMNNKDLYKGPKTVEAFPTAALEFVRQLAKIMRDEEWMEFRSFMKVLKHPVINGGMRTEQLPLWADEAQWITERQKMKPGAIVWKEFEYVFTKTAYVLLLTVTKGLEREMQADALRVIPAKYLVSKFKADFITSLNRKDAAPHFVVMCLDDSTNNHALRVFQERSMISDGFFETVLNEACIDPNSPRLLQVYNLLQIVVMKKDGTSLWNVEMLKLVPNLSSVLINFLYKIGKQKFFKRDEMIIGCIIMLVLQLEASKYEDTGSNKNEQRSIVNACTFASEWMHTDRAFVSTVSFPFVVD